MSSDPCWCGPLAGHIQAAAHAAIVEAALCGAGPLVLPLPARRLARRVEAVGALGCGLAHEPAAEAVPFLLVFSVCDAVAGCVCAACSV